MALIVGTLMARLGVDDSEYRAGMSRARGEAQSTSTSIAAAENRIRAARAATNAAALRTRAAEQQIAALRASGTATAAQIAAAEGRLTAARTAEAAASARAAQATNALRAAQAGATTQSNALAAAATRARGALATIGVGMSIAGVIAGLTQSVQAARALGAQTNQLNVVFGDNAGQIEAWGKTAVTSMRMSQREAQGAAVQFATFGKAMGASGQSLVNFSKEQTKLAADLASFQGIPVAEAIQAMGSAYAGETETMRQYGVLLDENTIKQAAYKNGVAEVGSELTVQQKAQGVYYSMMEQLGHVTNDVERSNGKFGASVKTLTARFEETQAAIGQKLIPVVQPFVDLLSGPGLSAVQGLASAIGAAGSAFNSLPGPVQSALAALVAFRVASHFMGDRVTSAMGRVTGAFRNLGQTATVQSNMGAVQMGRFGSAIANIGTHVPVIARMQTAFVNAAAGASRFPRAAGAASAAMTGMRGAASGLMGALGGPWGLAIAGATAALGFWMQKKQEDAAKSQEAKAATQEWADALTQSQGAINSQIREMAASKLAQEDLLRIGQSVGITQKDLTDAVLGSGEAYAKTRDKLGALVLEQTLAMNAGKAGAEALATSAALTAKESMNSVRNAYIQGRDRALDMAKATGDLSVSFDGTAQAAGTTSKAMKEFEESTGGAASKVDKLAKALNELQDDKITQEEALQAWSDNMRDLATAFTDGGAAMVKLDGHIDVTTEKGSKLQDAIVSQRDAYNETAAAALEYARSQKMGPGESLDYVTAKLEPLRKELIDTATAAGVPIAQAKRMADAYLGLPSDVITKLQLQGADEAIDKLKGLRVEGAKPIQGRYTMIENTKDVRATLDSMKIKYSVINGKVVINDEDIKKCRAALDVLGVETEALPDGYIKITDTSAENMARLHELGIKTQSLPDGTIVIDADDAEFWERVRKAQEPGEKWITIRTKEEQIAYGQGVIARLQQSARDQGYADGAITEYAGGGIRPAGVPSMPSNAVIERGRGNGLVRWAERETGWESYIPGDPSKRARSTVILKETARRFGYGLFPLNAIRAYANGAVADSGSYGMPAGGGGEFPDWVRSLESQYRVKASTYAGHQESDRNEPGYAPNPQGLNRGIDFSGSVADMQAFAEHLLSIAPSQPGIEQIIWQNPETGERIGWHGRSPDTDGSYFASDYPGHQDHVHLRASADITGTGTGPGTGAGIQDVTLTKDSSREDVARKIIAEGRKRGYSDDEIRGVLATAIQESNLDPNANGGGGAWHGIFQQDSSYAGRDDPNTNITGFYDRLDEKRKADPGADIYDSIFWLQQRPGEKSAKDAVANGRSGYLDEIKSKDDEAAKLLGSLGPSVGNNTDGGLGSTPGGSGTPVYVTNWPSNYTTTGTKGDKGDTTTTTPSTTTPGTGGRPRLIFRDSNGKSLMQKMQTGGTVPGTGIGDKIPLLAEPGEEIIRRKVAEQPGVRAFLKRINAGQPVIGKVRGLPRFQNGGTVGFGGYADDTTDYMKPRGWQDMLALGVGGAFAVADLVQPYVAMAQSGQVDLGSLSPQLNTGSNSADLGIPQMVGEYADDIKSQLAEIAKLLAKGERITVHIEQGKDSAADMVGMAARV